MAEFCKQCAKDLFGDDPRYNDAKGLISRQEVMDGYVMPFLCEGCGMTTVDHEGRCCTDCLEHHGPAENITDFDMPGGQHGQA